MDSNWNINIARKIYGLENYVRESYINVDEEGYLYINVNNKKIRVKELMDNLKLDIAYIRILPAIGKTMDMVYTAFKTIAEGLGYTGGFQPVFPMKVNPTPIVIEAIFEYGEKYKWGFNTGSIGEVRTLIKLAEKYQPRILIYDGVVTENVVQELLKLYRLGWRIFVDIESENDLEVLSKYPQLEIGIRVKPIVKLHGKWSGSVGLGSKFGVTTNALVKLKTDYKFITERASLLHMHPGSQLYKIQDLKNYFVEVRQVYNELKQLGFENIQIVDPGGGMAYPYIDARDGEEESPDYTVTDYFKELLNTMISITPNPILVFEGGRFIVSSHRIVATKVVDVRTYSAVHALREQVADVKEFNNLEEVKLFLDKIEKLIHDIRSAPQLENGRRELYEELVAMLREDLPSRVMELVKTGRIKIEDLVKDQKIFRLITSPTKRFVLNMSIFADIPDAVLVDQYFQPLPAQRLNEPPHVLASLSDLTCDSMGEIKLFISDGRKLQLDSPIFTLLDGKLIGIPGYKIKIRGVPLHLPSKHENYYVVFLDTGAYQDPLAMKHNLIYGAPEVIIREKNGEISIELVRHEELYT